MKLSTIVCTTYSYTFNDGSCVTWTPKTIAGKAHSMFAVIIHFEDGTNMVEDHVGPASMKASLHHLKNALKEKE